jgi:hypothetical protein
MYLHVETQYFASRRACLLEMSPMNRYHLVVYCLTDLLEIIVLRDCQYFLGSFAESTTENKLSIFRQLRLYSFNGWFANLATF